MGGDGHPALKAGRRPLTKDASAPPRHARPTTRRAAWLFALAFAALAAWGAEPCAGSTRPRSPTSSPPSPPRRWIGRGGSSPRAWWRTGAGGSPPGRSTRSTCGCWSPSRTAASPASRGGPLRARPRRPPVRGGGRSSRRGLDADHADRPAAGGGADRRRRASSARSASPWRWSSGSTRTRSSTSTSPRALRRQPRRSRRRRRLFRQGAAAAAHPGRGGAAGGAPQPRPRRAGPTGDPAARKWLAKDRALDRAAAAGVITRDGPRPAAAIRSPQRAGRCAIARYLAERALTAAPRRPRWRSPSTPASGPDRGAPRRRAAISGERHRRPRRRRPPRRRDPRPRPCSTWLGQPPAASST